MGTHYSHLPGEVPCSMAAEGFPLFCRPTATSLDLTKFNSPRRLSGEPRRGVGEQVGCST
jgi:hypothetical protein